MNSLVLRRRVSSGSPVSRQILPIGVLHLDQPDLLLAAPVFELSIPLRRVDRAVRALVPHQPVDVVPTREAGDGLGLVLGVATGSRGWRRRTRAWPVMVDAAREDVTMPKPRSLHSARSSLRSGRQNTR